MKFIIVSDTHGSTEYLRRVLAMHKDGDGVIFLGDGLSDLESVCEGCGMPLYAVRGNCDIGGYFLCEKVERIGELSLFGKKILYTHGDVCGVKSGDGELISLAHKHGADIVLHGHTHLPRSTYEDGLYIFNPGALSGYKPSFGIMTVDGENVLFSHGTFL